MDSPGVSYVIAQLSGEGTRNPSDHVGHLPTPQRPEPLTGSDIRVLLLCRIRQAFKERISTSAAPCHGPPLVLDIYVIRILILNMCSIVVPSTEAKP